MQDFDNILKSSSETINYDSSKIKIITVGRLVTAKNYPLLLKAFSKCCKEIKNIELWFVGDGPEKNELKELCKILGIEDSVKFWGYQSNPYKYISKADFFISSSSFEGFCLTIFEALLLKKRIITTRSISDFDDFITPEFGRVVPINDEEKLCDAIKKEIEEKKNIIDRPEFLEQFRLSNITDVYLSHLERAK